jgi:hypothetical protein
MGEFEKLKLKKFKIKSILPDATILILGKRRSGKSCIRGTKVLMYDGTIKNVEDIRVGEQVMGDDSTLRNVLETHSGIDTMYKVENKKGESYTVNSHHILSLKWTASKFIFERKERMSFQVRYFDKNQIKVIHKDFSYKADPTLKGQVYKKAECYYDNIIDDLYVDIPIKEYICLSKKYRENLLGYQVSALTFPEQKEQLPIDPYMMGYWLGNAYNNDTMINTNDPDVLSYFNNNLDKYNLVLELQKKYCYKINDKINDENCQNNNLFFSTLKNLGMLNNKHIPVIYKCNNRETRLKLLAGFIDADGHLSKRNDFEITQCKNREKLLDDIIYLARSLGFSAYKNIKKTSWAYNGVKKFGETFRIHINGQGIEKIPTLISRKRAQPRKDRVDALVSQITVKELLEDHYFGIELDGNNRYVLGNFIVTHNSFLVRDIFYHHREIPSGVVFSGTEEASPFFGDFIPDCFIHSEYDPELIDSIMNRQKRKIRESKNNGLSESGKHSSNNLFIVLDDMLHDAQNWKREKTIKSIFFNGRHYNFLFILTMQYAQGIPPELRSNIDYVFIFNEPSVANRKRIYEAYAGMIPSFEYFCNILDACTQNHECLIIKTSGNSSDIREQVFWYKAEAHTDFKVGHPDFWKYHKSNYNEKYEEEDDKNKEEFDKLKRKFAKTRKLKVIVSRQGDVVGYQQGD